METQEARDSELFSYAAGVLDSDGCISITSQGTTPRLVVVNTDRALPQWFCDHFGGNVYRHRPFKAAWRVTWQWVLHGDSATDLLRQVRKWLIVKHAQADLVIQFRERTHNPGGKRLSQSQKNERAEFIRRIRVLNARGV